MIIRLFFSLVLLVFFSACFSVSSYQTADTITKGKTELGIGLAVVKTDNYIAGSGEGHSTPILEFISRYGVLDNLDFGLKLSGFEYLDLDFKFRLLSFGSNESKFSMAIKPLISIPTLKDEGNFKTLILNSTRLSFLMSKKFNRVLGIYLSLNFHPRLSNTEKENSDPNDSSELKEYLFSGNLGLSIEEKSFWFRPELIAIAYNSEFAVTFGAGIGTKF